MTESYRHRVRDWRRQQCATVAGERSTQRCVHHQTGYHLLHHTDAATRQHCHVALILQMQPIMVHSHTFCLGWDGQEMVVASDRNWDEMGRASNSMYLNIGIQTQSYQCIPSHSSQHNVCVCVNAPLVSR